MHRQFLLTVFKALQDELESHFLDINLAGELPRRVLLQSFEFQLVACADLLEDLADFFSLLQIAESVAPRRSARHFYELARDLRHLLQKLLELALDIVVGENVDFHGNLALKGHSF